MRIFLVGKLTTQNYMFDEADGGGGIGSVVGSYVGILRLDNDIGGGLCGFCNASGGNSSSISIHCKGSS